MLQWSLEEFKRLLNYESGVAVLTIHMTYQWLAGTL